MGKGDLTGLTYYFNWQQDPCPGWTSATDRLPSGLESLKKHVIIYLFKLLSLFEILQTPVWLIKDDCKF